MELQRFKKLTLYILFLILLVSFVSALVEDEANFYYKLNEGSGTNTIDEKDKQNGTLTADSWKDGIEGYGFNSSGSQGIFLGTIEAMGMNIVTNFSISTWVNFSAVTVQQVVVGFGGVFHIGLDVRSDLVDCGGNFSTYWAGEPGVGSTEMVCTNVTPVINTWYHLVYTQKNGSQKFYVNGLLAGEDTVAEDIAWAPIGTRYGSMGYRKYLNNLFTKGVIDEVSFYLDKVLTSVEVSTLYGEFIVEEDTTSPIITFKEQIPSDLDTFNIYETNMDITYNITDISGINESEVKLYHKTNNTISDVWIYRNGTKISGYTLHPQLRQNNISSIWNFTNIDDNMVYPATYNFDEESLELIPYQSYEIDNTNKFYSIRLFNVTNSKNYSYFEVMLNCSGSAISRITYCNETYNFNSKPTTNSNCVDFAVHSGNIYNHTHTNYSSHIAKSFPINSSGYIANIFVTSTSYFIISKIGGVGSCFIHSISNISREDTIKLSTNQGNSYSNISETANAHLHQYDGSDTFYYFVTACDNLNNCGNSTIRSDLIDLAGLPPSSPDVYLPVTDRYNANIDINYTASTSPNSYPISFYNITLVDITFNFVQIIKSNNSLNLNYIWDSLEAASGDYFIRIEACDILGQCSFGFSENITIDNIAPIITSILPLEDNTSVFENIGSILIKFNATDNDNLYVYNLTIEELLSSIIKFNESAIISGLTYSYSKNITTLNWNNVTYLEKLRVCDSHSLSAIPDLNVIKRNSSLKFQFGKIIIDVKSINGNELSADSIKLEDRYTFNFGYSKSGTPKVYELSSNFNIVYLPFSKYKGHFIINNLIWVDFNTADDVAIEKTDDGYLIYVDNKEKDITFSSIGFLNCVTEHYQFNLTTVTIPTLYDIGLLTGNWFNTSILVTSTTAGVLLYFLLFVIFICLIAFSEYSQIPAFMFLSGLFGFFLGFLFYVILSAVLGLIFIVLSVFYLIRSAMFAGQ